MATTMFAIVGFGPSGLGPMQMIVLPNQVVFPKAEPTKPSSDAIGVCLDYAMGTCTRAHCKYPHPDLAPLHRMREQYSHLGVVCEVFALTGHCRFGAKCTKMHPTPDALPKAQPLADFAPKHISLRATPTHFIAAGARGRPEPTSFEPKASVFDTFAEEMRQSLAQLEKNPSGKPSAAPAQVNPLLSCGMDQIYLDILRDLGEALK